MLSQTIEAKTLPSLPNRQFILSVLTPITIVGLGLVTAWLLGGKVEIRLDAFTAVPQSLSAVLVAVVAGFMLFTSKIIFQKPLWAILALLAIFFWEALFSKITQLAFGLTGLAALGVFLTHFQWLWKLPVFRWGLGFTLISAIFFFTNASSFQLASIGAGYQSELFKNTADSPAKVAVVVWAFSVAVGLMTGLRIFIPKKNQRIQPSPADWLQQWGVFIGMALFFILGFFIIAFPVAMETAHLNMYLPPTLLFTQFIAGWIRSGVEAGVPLKTPKWLSPSKLSQWLGIMVLILWLLFPLIANKATLIAGFMVLGLQAIILKKTGIGINWGWPKLPKISVIQQLIMGVSLTILTVLVLVATGLSTAFTEKIDYFANGFNNTSTLKIREDNLHHLFEEWRSNLSPKVVLLGNGLAASRHDIFFVSAQRRWNFGILVQTTHNAYVELFYDYGMMALLYFATWAVLFFSALKTVRSNRIHPVAKHAAILILCFTFFFGANGLVDGIVAPCMTQTFTMLGLLEGIRRFWPQLPMTAALHSNFSQQLLLKQQQQNSLSR